MCSVGVNVAECRRVVAARSEGKIAVANLPAFEKTKPGTLEIAFRPAGDQYRQVGWELGKLRDEFAEQPSLVGLHAFVECVPDQKDTMRSRLEGPSQEVVYLVHEWTRVQLLVHRIVNTLDQLGVFVRHQIARNSCQQLLTRFPVVVVTGKEKARVCYTHPSCHVKQRPGDRRLPTASDSGDPVYRWSGTLIIIEEPMAQFFQDGYARSRVASRVHPSQSLDS